MHLWLHFSLFFDVDVIPDDYRFCDSNFPSKYQLNWQHQVELSAPKFVGVTIWERLNVMNGENVLLGSCPGLLRFNRNANVLPDDFCFWN